MNLNDGTAQTNFRIELQLRIDRIYDIQGVAGLERMIAAADDILRTLDADPNALSAVDREAARMSGVSLGELAAGQARDKSIEKAWSALSREEAHVLRMLDGDHADPRAIVAAKASAESELRVLSSIVRGDLAARCAGDPLQMLTTARAAGLL